MGGGVKENKDVRGRKTLFDKQSQLFLHGIVEDEPSSSELVKELGWDFDLEIGA